MKDYCKKNGIKYKQCFVAGYEFLKKGKVENRKEKTQEIEEILEGNRRLQRKLTELALKVRDLEAKKGGFNE
jgi:hypothetical protein